MKEELQSKLVEILTSIQAATGAARDFAVDQLPDVVQSYLTYGRVTWTLAVAVLLVLLAATLTMLAHAFRGTHLSEDRRMTLGMMGAFGSMLIGPLLATAGNEALLIWLSPKVWLLKAFAGLVK